MDGAVNDRGHQCSGKIVHKLLLFWPEIGDWSVDGFSDSFDDTVLRALAVDNRVDLLRADAKFFGDIRLLDASLPQ
jgi:hypothetical protein